MTKVNKDHVNRIKFFKLCQYEISGLDSVIKTQFFILLSKTCSYSLIGLCNNRQACLITRNNVH
jgi:hypothetical protein